MTQAIDPNTHMPMSFKIEKLQQMKQSHTAAQQSFINQEQQIIDEKKQRRVNENEEAEQGKINDKQEQQAYQEKNRRNQSGKKNDEQHQEEIKGYKGSIIDVKI